MTKTVVLTVGSTTYSGESVTLNYALESLTLRSTDNIDKCNALSEDVCNSQLVAEIKLPCEVRLKLNELAHRVGSCLFEVPLKRRAGVLFCGFVIGKLHCGVSIFLHGTDLRDNARTSLDDGAWQVLAISTENGSHSDFLSN